jgi:PAS domain-containing protein
MDFSRFALSDWSPIAGAGAIPEALVAAAVSALATLALVAGFAPRMGLGAGALRPTEDGACDFFIEGANVRPVTPAARALLSVLPREGSRLTALAAHLAVDWPDSQSELEALVLYGAPFRHYAARDDGDAVVIAGEPREDGAFLSIRPASEEARALRETQAALARTAADRDFLRDVLDRAPVLAWSHGRDGKIAWANGPYRERFDGPADELPDHRITDGFAHVVEEVPLTTRGADSRRRVSVPGRDDAEPHWFELCQTPGPAGETLGYALAADDIVAAESSLRRFVETLTETFAHLPIGLAVFDKNRRLGLFNPALTDLVKIDAVWLAGRPSLRDFLERLRETRQMPEQKDFATWRRKLTELEEGARDGTYEENWQLPSGKIFRVTGRPHPQGALAFLFEDISTAIMLERRYRSELEIGQATLDRISEAVAVFDASGTLVFVNAAFESLWGLDPMARLDGPGVTEMTSFWEERCFPTAAWSRFAEFATAADSRTSWTESLATRDGRALRMLVAPLPDASALVVFGDPVPEARDGLLDEIALEHVRLPAEQALPRLLAALPAAQTPEAFKSLGAAMQGLKDGLARSQALTTLALSPAAPGTPLPQLAAALRARGLVLDAPAEAGGWEAPVRRAAIALGLAAADGAASGASLSISLAAVEGGRRLRVSAPSAAGEPRPDGFGIALARRVLDTAGGTLEIGVEDGTVSLAAFLPERAPVRQAV